MHEEPRADREERHARDRRGFFNPKTIEPIAGDHPLREREEASRRNEQQHGAGGVANVEEHGKQADQRVDDHVAEDEQRDAQESIGAAQIDLQFRDHPFPLLRLKQAGLGPVLHHPLLADRPLVVTRIDHHSSRPNLRASTTSRITTIDPVTMKYVSPSMSPPIAASSRTLTPA